MVYVNIALNRHLQIFTFMVYCTFMNIKIPIGVGNTDFIAILFFSLGYIF